MSDDTPLDGTGETDGAVDGGHPDDAAKAGYGAEFAPDDSAPDIVARGAKKDRDDAEKKRRQNG